MSNSPKKGLFVGKSHANGGIPSKVLETGQLLEIEGDEYYICRSAYNSSENYEFKGKTNKEVLDHIYSEHSCKLTQSAMSAGDFIVCKVVVLDSNKHDRSGTVKQILNEMQGEKSCKVEASSDSLQEGGEIPEHWGEEWKEAHRQARKEKFLGQPIRWLHDYGMVYGFELEDGSEYLIDGSDVVYRNDKKGENIIQWAGSNWNFKHNYEKAQKEGDSEIIFPKKSDAKKFIRILNKYFPYSKKDREVKTKFIYTKDFIPKEIPKITTNDLPTLEGRTIEWHGTPYEIKDVQVEVEPSRSVGESARVYFALVNPDLWLDRKNYSYRLYTDQFGKIESQETDMVSYSMSKDVDDIYWDLNDELKEIDKEIREKLKPVPIDKKEKGGEVTIDSKPFTDVPDYDMTIKEAFMAIADAPYDRGNAKFFSDWLKRLGWKIKFTRGFDLSDLSEYTDDGSKNYVLHDNRTGNEWVGSFDRKSDAEAARRFNSLELTKDNITVKVDPTENQIKVVSNRSSLEKGGLVSKRLEKGKYEVQYKGQTFYVQDMTGVAEGQLVWHMKEKELEGADSLWQTKREALEAIKHFVDDPDEWDRQMSKGGSLKENIDSYYHASPEKLTSLTFTPKTSGESNFLGEGIYITNDKRYAESFLKEGYLHEVELLEPLNSLPFSSDILNLQEIVDKFRDSNDDDLEYLAEDYQEKLDENEAIWGKTLIEDLERNNVNVNDTLIYIGFNSIDSQFNRSPLLRDYPDSSKNINVIKEGVVAIKGVEKLSGGGAISLATKEQLIEKMEAIKQQGQYLNCELFCNIMVSDEGKSFKEVYHRIENPSVDEFQLGDILQFGELDNPRHYAVYLGGDKVLEAEEWGATPREASLAENLDSYEGISAIYRDVDSMEQGGNAGNLLIEFNNAPNGNPSNLTPDQYKLVRTDAFKKWFGDWENDPENASKVVDENGEPKVVYHGAPKKAIGFTKFDTKLKYERNQGDIVWTEFGAFFTDNYETARFYAYTSENRDMPQYAGEIRAFFLNIRNPIEKWLADAMWYEAIPDIFARETGVWWKRMKVENPYTPRDKRNDGFIIEGINEAGVPDTTTYHIKKSNQAKLADGTNTTFKEKDFDIRYKGGGIVSGYFDDELSFLNW